MRNSVIIALAFLTILFVGCTPKVESVNNEVSGERELESKEVETKNKTKEALTETAEIVEPEAATKESGSIEHNVNFNEEEMSDFKKAFNDKDFTYNPFMYEADYGPSVFAYDTHYGGYNLSANKVYYFVEDGPHLLISDLKTNYVFPESIEGTLITDEEQIFLDDLIAYHTNGCPIGNFNIEEVKKINEATEENFMGTEDVIKEFYGSSEGLVQQSIEGRHYCYREVMGYDYEDVEYSFLELTSDEIDEGITIVNYLIDSKEDYIYDIETMNDESPYLFSTFEFILRTNEDLIANENKQTYIKYLKEDLITFFPYIKEYIKWSEEDMNEDHTINDEELYNGYIESYDLSLEQLKVEEDYLLGIAEKMKSNGLEGLLQF